MRQETFQRRHATDWSRIEGQLRQLESPPNEAEGADFPQLYRRLCQHLSLARYRGYGTDLVSRLNDLAVRGHHQLYTRRGAGVAEAIRDLVGWQFPEAVRREWRLVLLSHLLFYGPLLGMIVGIGLRPELVYSVVEPATVSSFEAMYDPASDHHLKERASDSDVLMFGFYIYNNIGIAFRTFASGVLAGAGSIFFLVYNGFVIGATAGHLQQVGYGSTFWPFVITHGSFELTAIVLAGVSGLRLGLAILSPGQLTRGRALVAAGRKSLPVLYGLTAFLLLAAFIEAFWSSSATLPVNLKYAVGGSLWVLVYAYLLLAGRRGGPHGA